MRPGETDPNKKRITFPLFDTDGLPASGKTGSPNFEGAVWVPVAGEIQYNRDEAGWVNATLANFAHVSGGNYRYMFANAEIAGTVEGLIQFRCKDDATAALGGIREQTVGVPLERAVTDAGGPGITSTAATTLLMRPGTYQMVGFTTLKASGVAANADALPTVSVTNYHTVEAYAPVPWSYGNGRYAIEVYAGPTFLEDGWSGSIFVTATIDGVVTTKAVTDYRIAETPAFPHGIPQKIFESIAVRVDDSIKVRFYLHDPINATLPISTVAAPAGFASWTIAHCAPGDASFTGSGTGLVWLGYGWVEATVSGAAGDSGRPGTFLINSNGEVNSIVANVAYQISDENIDISAGLLQGNFFIDQTVNTNPLGQTSARMRVFRNAADAAAATDGGVAEGEFATFTVTTTYVADNKILTHRVVRV